MHRNGMFFRRQITAVARHRGPQLRNAAIRQFLPNKKTKQKKRHSSSKSLQMHTRILGGFGHKEPMVTLCSETETCKQPSKRDIGGEFIDCRGGKKMRDGYQSATSRIPCPRWKMWSPASRAFVDKGGAHLSLADTKENKWNMTGPLLSVRMKSLQWPSCRWTSSPYQCKAWLARGTEWY